MKQNKTVEKTYIYEIVERRSASKTEKAVNSGAQLVVKCLHETAFSLRLKDWN